MKRQNHGMTINTDNQWPIEEMEEKKEILSESSDRREIGKHIHSIARAKVGCDSEHYHRAVAELAYQLWEKNGRPQDSADRNWFQAEATLTPQWAADLSFAS